MRLRMVRASLSIGRHNLASAFQSGNEERAGGTGRSLQARCTIRSCQVGVDLNRINAPLGRLDTSSRRGSGRCIAESPRERVTRSFVGTRTGPAPIGTLRCRIEESAPRRIGGALIPSTTPRVASSRRPPWAASGALIGRGSRNLFYRFPRTWCLFAL